jgi:hypothetical protein
MWQCSPLIAEYVRYKIVVTLLALTLIILNQPLNTQSLYATNHIHIIDIQYCRCMYNHSNPGVVLHHNFSSTAIYAIWVKNDVALHQQKTFPSGRNGSVRVDALHQSRQRHSSGWLLHARHQCRASRCILPSERCFAISSHSVGLLIETNTLAL